MRRFGVPHAVAAFVILAVTARVAAVFWGGRIHPDGPYQYLEPSWQRLFGAGLEAWEWRQGVRSWALTGYNGGWIALLSALGVDGPAVPIVVRLHWALASLVVLWAAWRCGDAIERAGTESDGHVPAMGGLFALGAVALFGPIVLMAPQPLSENPATIAAVASFALAERAAQSGARRESAWLSFASGAAIAASVFLRISFAPLAIGPVLVLVARRRTGFLLPLGAGFAGVALIFGAIDRLTWGGWFSSFVAYLSFNFVQGRASDFGTSPPLYYVRELVKGMPLALLAMGVPALLALRVTWPYLATSGLLLAALSTQGHKEPRFVTAVFPLLLVASAGGLAIRLRPLWGRDRRRAWTVVAALAVVSLVDGWRANFPPRDLLEPAIDSAAWLARRRDLGGVLLDDVLATNGYHTMPHGTLLLRFDAALLENPLVHHVLAAEGSAEEARSLEAGFRRAYARKGRVVLSRPGP